MDAAVPDTPFHTAVDDDCTSWLPCYRMVAMGAAGHGTRVEVIEARDDAEALARARDAAGSSAFELWDALSLLGRYGPGS